jgi:hypothetical protein
MSQNTPPEVRLWAAVIWVVIRAVAELLEVNSDRYE